MIAVAAWGLAGLLCLVHLVTAALAAARFLRPARAAPRLPEAGVTLLRPVRGVDPHDAATLGSSFYLNHPDFEVIFCAQHPDDPAVALVQELIARHPAVQARLLIGEDGRLRNPKLRNLSKGWAAARHDRICMADANLLLPPDYLQRVFDAWGPRTGMVSSPPFGIEPEGLVGHLECAFLNANQARLQLAIDSLGQGFAQGKTMAFQREMLDRAGGLAALDRLMAEDVNATRLMRRLGLRVSLTRRPFAQPVGRRTFRQVWDRQVRWAQVRREGFPWLYLLEPLNGAVAPLALLALGAGWTDLSLLVLLPFAALWYGVEIGLARLAGWPMGWRDAAVLPLRDLLLPMVWLAALLRRDFEWRGTIIAPGASDQSA